MSKPLSLDPDVIARLKHLPKNQREASLRALADLAQAFGQPHVHSGLGIRKLGGRLLECRGGLELRFIFQIRPDDLYVCFLGNHDEVKAVLRRGKYR